MGERFTTTLFGAICLTVFTILLAAYLGGAVWIGAHPLWQMQVAFVGVGIGGGLVLFAALIQLGFRLTSVFSITFLGIALFVANFGKSRFVASYAEDWLAGRLWYYGAMAVSAALFLCVFVVIQALIGHFAKINRSK